MPKASKLEHCPQCKSTEMKNYIHVEAGRDMEVFVECNQCSSFVARYTLKMYTCDKPYESFLRLMRKRRMASGSSTSRAFKDFQEELQNSFQKVKDEVLQKEDTRKIEEILSDD